MIAFVLYKVGLAVRAFIDTLWVEGKPNEWVVIMSGGKQKQAGIGLNTIVGPFDQVAIFPSKLNKVEVRTQQVTKEIQGVEVKSMIEWTVDREGDGPMRAFKNLDIDSAQPYKANETLRAMTSAIIRNKIANSTIDEILKNRQGLREAVMKEMTEVTRGWGVHLATVEVTDVRICSGSLFRDMQTQFREQNTKKAAVERLEVQTALREQEMSHGITDHKRTWDTKKVQAAAVNAQKLQVARDAIKILENNNEIEKKAIKRQHGFAVEQKEIWVQKSQKQLEVELVEKKASIDQAIKQEVARREVQASEDAVALHKLRQDITREEVAAAQQRSIKQADYDLTKESLKDPVQRQMKQMDVIESLYHSMSISSFEVNQMGETDPVAEMVSRFVKLADVPV